MKLLTRTISGFLLFSFAVLTVNVATAAKIELYQFETKQQERLYQRLVTELRCVKCQNQNLAESNAELATDMREKTYKMVTAGKSRQDVVDYMTARYGYFVLYRPPFKAKTYILWIGPPVLLFLSLFFLLRKIRKHKIETVDVLNDKQHESMRELLKK